MKSFQSLCYLNLQKSKNGRNEKFFFAEFVLLVPINHPSKFLPSLKNTLYNSRESKKCKIEVLYKKLCTLKHTVTFKKFQNMEENIYTGFLYLRSSSTG